MCVIQQYFVIYPNGHREEHDRLRWCPRGTPSRPCNQTEIVDMLEDEYALPPKAPCAPLPRVQVLEPRVVRRQPQAKTVKCRKKAPDGIKAVWDIRIPGTSCKKKPISKERELVCVKKGGNPRPEPLPPIIHPPPPPPHPPPIHGPPMIVERSPRLVEVYIELNQERECRMRAEHTARAEEEARLRAQEDAEKVRRQRDREKKRNSALKREKRQLEKEKRDRAASEEREKRRKADERARAESRERARRRALEAVEQREEEARALAESRERARRRVVEAAMRRREEEEERAMLERIRRREADEAARLRDERAQISWLHRQRIPHEPRHPPVVYQGGRGSLEERGDRVISIAIRARERRQAEADAGWFR